MFRTLWIIEQLFYFILFYIMIHDTRIYNTIYVYYNNMYNAFLYVLVCTLCCVVTFNPANLNSWPAAHLHVWIKYTINTQTAY